MCGVSVESGKAKSLMAPKQTIALASETMDQRKCDQLSGLKL